MLSRRTILTGSLTTLLASRSQILLAAGIYYEPPQTEWLPGSRSMRLLRDFRYRDSSGLMWIAKKGAKVDGASIPRVAWTIAGSPYDPPYRDASVIHDFYCDTMKRSWEATHAVFLDAMLTSKTDEVEAYTKYYAVKRAGPRWDSQYRWSGMWPVKRPRHPSALNPLPPPPTLEQQLEAEKKAAALQQLIEEQVEAVRFGLANGTLSPGDLDGLAQNQIATQPSINF